MRFHFDGHSTDLPTGERTPAESPGDWEAATNEAAVTQVPEVARRLTRLIGGATDGLHGSLNSGLLFIFVLLPCVVFNLRVCLCLGQCPMHV